MASQDIFLQGKCKWNHLWTPDAAFGDPKFKLMLYPDAASYEKILKLKESPAIMNVIGKDEDGYFINISRPQEINNKGRRTMLPMPEVLDGKKPLPSGGYEPLRNVSRLGHGSDVTVKCEVRSYTLQTTKRPGRSLRLTSVRVDNLVPYEPNRDLTDPEKKIVEGLDQQPEQLF